MRVGVVGYSSQPFDQELARAILRRVFDVLDTGSEIEIVSGLTHVGIPAIAYEEAVCRGWRTVGIACSQATEFPCFPVDEVQIVGHHWGDESQVFLNRIDLLIRIGGGKQSYQESHLAKMHGKFVIEYDLPTLNCA